MKYDLKQELCIPALDPLAVLHFDNQLLMNIPLPDEQQATKVECKSQPWTFQSFYWQIGMGRDPSPVPRFGMRRGLNPSPKKWTFHSQLTKVNTERTRKEILEGNPKTLFGSARHLGQNSWKCAKINKALQFEIIIKWLKFWSKFKNSKSITL